MNDPLRRHYRLMIAILAITAYWPTLAVGFLWDDHVMIEANPALHQWSLPQLRDDFSHDVFNGHGDPYYRPLQTLMNRVDYSLWGLHPWGYHLTNFLFHLGNAFLVSELVLVFGLPWLTAFIAGSLFAVHPIGVEQLMIVAGRAELMGLFFTLAAILLGLHKERWATFASAFAFVLGLLSKESAIVTPFLLAGIFTLNKERQTTYHRLLPMLLIIPPYLWLRQQIVGPALTHWNPELILRFFFQEFPIVLLRYVGLVFVPWNLHSHRLLPHIPMLWPLYLLGCAAVMYYAYRRFPRTTFFSVGWLILSLLPKTPAMIYGNFMLDHWMYPAAIAVFFPLAQLVAAGWSSARRDLRVFTAVAYFGFLILTALLVHLNVALRGTDEKMYRWALYFTSSNPVKYNLGIQLLQTQRFREAIDYLEDVNRVYPDDPKTLRALAFAYWGTGQQRLAIHMTENFLKTYPSDPQLVAQLQDMKRREKAYLPSR